MIFGGDTLRVDTLQDALPFLDPDARPRELLAAVAALRSHRAATQNLVATEGSAAPEHWFEPGVALSLWDSEPPTWNSVSSRDLCRIASVLHEISHLVPKWQSYFRLPMKYLRLPPDSRAISASVPCWPQHIMLSDVALATETELREQLVHEWCHQWIYLLEEVCPLQLDSLPRDMILPSGTGERYPREIIGAAHVGGALRQLYEASHLTYTQANYFTEYTHGCLDVLDSVQDMLTEPGRQITSRMRERLMK